MRGKPMTARLGKARFAKRADVVAEELKRWIVTEMKRPGDKLPQEAELAESFQTSRWTIREALKSLEVQGLIKVTPGSGGGARVAEVSEQSAVQLLANFFYFRPLTVKNLYQVRIVLEPLLAEEVVGRLEERHFLAMEQAVSIAKREVRTEEDTRELRAAEIEFHNVLASACNNVLLGFFCRFINSLLNDWIVFNETYIKSGDRFTGANVEYHEALIDAFRRKDREAVVRLMRDHMQNAAHHTNTLNAEISTKFLS
jgi:GntR family transcriptional regulator, transcriptional repressor for pyruvate dehydrogenase complex